MAHGPGPKGRISGRPEKAKNFWGTTKRLLKYMSSKIYAVLAVFIFAIVGTIFQIRAPKRLGEATTEIFEGVKKGFAMMQKGEPIKELPVDFDAVKTILVSVGIMFLVSALMGLLQQLIMTRVSQKTVYQLRNDLKEKMNKVPIKYYDTHSNGDIMSRAINDMDNISGTLQQSLTQLLTSVVTFVGVLWMMLSISWQLTLVALLTVPLSLIVVMIVAPKSQKFFSTQQKSLGLLNDQIEETYAGHTVIKAFNYEEESITEFEKENEILFEVGWKAQFISAMIMPLMNFIKNLGYVFVAVLGGIKVANGNMTLGNVQAFLQYTTQFSQPITQMANLMNTIQATIASAERIFEVLDEEEMTDEKSNIAPISTPNKIIFDHVQFGYDSEDLLMTDFNLEVPEGNIIAIVGPTGAGKTTLINLLERFYDVSGGCIKLDGKDIRDISREELRSRFSMVLQDTWLFTGTIFDNIAYGRKDATEEEIIRAAKAAHADEFIRRLPDGYQTILNEEASNISQGQRQLLTIARAFLANPEILILDEATSSVDTRTESLIQTAMGRLLKGRTSFVVAHRLSTIRDANKIIVMNHGEIVETGNHDELMEKNGFYAELYNSQFSEDVAV